MSTTNIGAFPYPKTISCVNCKSDVTLYDPTGCEYFVCPKCRSYVHYQDGKYQNVRGEGYKPETKPVIPLGSAGTLRGIDYKVIGFMEKKEVGTEYYWREYLLYSYKKAYAFLAEFDGHWSYIAGIEHYPDLNTSAEIGSGQATYDSKDFTLFNKYHPKVMTLMGEFDWDVLFENVETSEFIAPPYLLVHEKQSGSKKNDWYLGTYIEPKEIAEAFKISISDFPQKIGVGANQPTPWYFRWNILWRVTLALLLIVLAATVAIAMIKPGGVVLNQNYYVELAPLTKPDSTKKIKPDTAVKTAAKPNTTTGAAARPDTAKNWGTGMISSYNHKPDTSRNDTNKKDTARQDTAKAKTDSINAALSALRLSANPNASNETSYELRPVVTHSFDIKSPASVDVELHDNLSNNWTEANMVLVNEKTNETWSITKNIEYYHGYDDGESWSEGSTSETVTLSHIAAGRYHINIYPFSGDPTTREIQVIVSQDDVLYGNMFTTMLLLCIYPLFCLVMWQIAERRRWANSDYSPYQKSED